MAHSHDLRLNDVDFDDRIFQLIYNNGDKECDVDVEDSDQDPVYVVSADSAYSG